MSLLRRAALAAAGTAALALSLPGCAPTPGHTLSTTAGPPAAPTPAGAAGAAPGRITPSGQPSITGRTRCADYTVPVTLNPTKLEIYPHHVVVELCSATGWKNHTVQLLVPGAGYDARYWRWPDPHYSYVAAATADPSGYVTAAINLLGTGPSEHPAGAELTINVQAWVVRQVVQDLDGGLFGFPSGPIVLVGHSVGGYIAWTEAAHWGGVDGLVLLDAAHSRQPTQVAAIKAAQHPAGDPRFDGKGWASHGYVALEVGARCRLYHGPHPDKAACAEDERLNATTAIPTGELASLAAALASHATTTITVPVLVGMGDQDALFCPHRCSAGSSPVRQECPTWYPSAYQQGKCGLMFEADAGHDTNLGPGARDLYARIGGWVRQEVTR
jgi:pimeloyl-ACP methyl ester carboxylesterase